jgi:DNA-binding NarL/FixJ family response regulator
MTGHTIRILIVDDHPSVSEGLAALLSRQPDMLVVGNVASVLDSVTVAAEFGPDVVIWDVDRNGAAADQTVRLHEMSSQAKLIFLTRHNSETVRFAALEAGPRAFLRDTRAAEDLLAAIRWVYDAGTVTSSPTVAMAPPKESLPAARIETLTKREREVLRLMAEGASGREIASGLGISYNTVRSHVRILGWKLAAHNKLQTVVKARQLALID